MNGNMQKISEEIRELIKANKGRIKLIKEEIFMREQEIDVERNWKESENKNGKSRYGIDRDRNC